jgi:hypothetical protein
MSVVARARFLSDFGPLFISLKHRAMPRTRDPMWAHFTEAGQIKTRIKYKCEFKCAPFVLRNVDQLMNHLASP